MSHVTRRQFMKSTAAGATVAFAAPAIATAKKSGARTWMGTDEHPYEIQHDWPQLPDRF
jgi:anaerobic selenocysteine-containing dehydrogenase